MKRFTKISLILSGGFLLLGIVLCLTAYTMGGRVGDLSVSYDSEKHSFVTGDQIKVTEGEEQHFQNIENLDHSIWAWAELTVCYGSGKDFVLRSVGTGKFFCEQNGTTLKVNSKKAQYFFGINISSFGRSKDVAIVLEVPKGTDIRKLKAQVGVGTLTVNDLQVEELDGECGVGEFDFSGEIKKFGNLKCGIGSMYLNLVGSEKDYDYSLECGMGNISLGDRDFSGLGSGQEISNGSDKKFTLECGMGELRWISKKKHKSNDKRPYSRKRKKECGFLSCQKRKRSIFTI